ncbi:hypothetical protein FB45DRAFT_1004256 [Roridomyces roridus]|uniref:Uncharacterized protein n=1 Tax=Roridomyces roridus TaxID=1738132 RepID=A0AAD7FK04_9AGAR|nr:hypothetical protein FB45DRAFT_1004256 [Roridomyces roridus]
MPSNKTSLTPHPFPYLPDSSSSERAFLSTSPAWPSPIDPEQFSHHASHEGPQSGSIGTTKGKQPESHQKDIKSKVSDHWPQFFEFDTQSTDTNMGEELESGVSEFSASIRLSPEFSDTPLISTFVIVMPSGLSGTNDPTAINREDLNYLQTHVQDGGNACTVYRSSDAEEWVEQNFDTPLLVYIRWAGLGGPIATMVKTLQLAQNLADESTFAVMVRPGGDYPVRKLEDEDEMDEGESAIPENSDDEEDEEEEEEEMPRTEGVFRLRGGAGPRERNLNLTDHADPDYIGSTGVDRPDGIHQTRVRLHLQIQGDCLYDMAICSKTAFKFQTAKSDISPSLSDPISRPQLLSCVDLKVETRPAEIVLDRSYSNIGFVVHSPNFIADREYLPRGFHPPLQTVTYGSQKSMQRGGSISAGMDSWSPTVLLGASSSRTTGETIQRADDKPAPSWHVKEQVGKEWNSADKSYSSYDIALSPTNLPHPLEIRFGMGIGFYGREERRISKLPAISHVLRNQIILWVADSTLKAKMRGMIVLTTTYIPDIKTSEPLTIVEDQTVDLRLKHAVATKDNPSFSEGHVAANSVAIGVFEPQQKKKSGMQRFMDNLRATSTKQPSVPVEVPLYEYTSRGWDATNEQWRNTIWPRLDADFADAGLSSSSARWNVTLNRPPTAGKSRDQEKPDEDAEIHMDVTGSVAHNMDASGPLAAPPISDRLHGGDIAQVETLEI